MSNAALGIKNDAFQRNSPLKEYKCLIQPILEICILTLQLQKFPGPVSLQHPLIQAPSTSDAKITH